MAGIAHAAITGDFQKNISSCNKEGPKNEESKDPITKLQQ